MIRDRAEPVQLFELVPQLQLRFEPELAELDRLLEDDELFQQVRGDLARRRPQSLRTGRPSTPVEVILRLLVVKHLYGWSYEETEHFVNDSLVLRQFCRLGLAPAPDDTTLLRWANLIQPATMHRLLDRVTELARQRRVTRGRKLRTDSTVVETAVHYPSDSGLLSDGVRVLSRLVKRARPLLPELGEAATAARELFRDRTRSARRLAQRISKTTVRASQAQDRAAAPLPAAAGGGPGQPAPGAPGPGALDRRGRGHGRQSRASAITARPLPGLGRAGGQPNRAAGPARGDRPGRRESDQPVRAAHRRDRAGEGAPADRVRPQGRPRRSGGWPGHPVRGCAGQPPGCGELGGQSGPPSGVLRSPARHGHRGPRLLHPGQRAAGPAVGRALGRPAPARRPLGGAPAAGASAGIPARLAFPGRG